jgi:hypothetical protein
MSKQQRLYYEYQNKERVRQELIEYSKQTIEHEKIQRCIQLLKTNWN